VLALRAAARYACVVPFVPIAFVLLLLIAFIPLMLLVRLRLGSARRRARGWVVTLNVAVLGVSTVVFLMSAVIVNVWIPDALKSAVIGLAFGALISLFGLAFTHWEKTPHGVFYKPNRWFALLIPMALTVRIIYWMWRCWHTWAASGNTTSWLAASGTAGSLGVGAAVAGYYFGYAVGVWHRVSHSDDPHHHS
jgi:hypothetical protein